MEMGGQGKTCNNLPAITFRPFERSETDIAAIMDLGTDERVNRFLHFDLFRSRDDAVRFIETFVLPHPWFRFICLSDAGDEPVGSVLLRSKEAGGGRRMVSIGYSVVPEMWGRGIATAAVRMVMKMVFQKWEGVERLQAATLLENLASQRVLEKAGFQREGVLRKYMLFKGQAADFVIYSFVSTDCRFSIDEQVSI